MSNTQSLIEQFYQEEQKRMADEASFTPLDLSISAADMAMLSTIARRFGKDKSLFARDALSQALVDMFSALEPAERKMLAKEADELANSISAEIAEEQGLNNIDVLGNNWVAQDKACVKAERKAEKERKELEAKLSSLNTNSESLEQQDTTQADMSNETTMSDAAQMEPEINSDAETKLDSEAQSDNSESDMPESIFGSN